MVVRRLPNNELYHHGILGQKWGVRRYQNKDGTLTNAGRKKKGLVQTIKDKRKAKKLRDAKERKRKETEYKESIIRSGDKKLVNKNKHMLNDDELKRALDRIDMSNKLDSYSSGGSNAATAKKGKDYMDNINSSLKLISNAADATSKTINAVTTVNKFMNEHHSS